MFPYSPTQLFSMHPHPHHDHHHHHHHQQQYHHHQQQQQHHHDQRQQPLHHHQHYQQQQPNMVYYQYNQLHSPQLNYSNPALTSGIYMQQPIEQQQQQAYLPDQSVPQSTMQVTTPVQPQQQIPRSSPNTSIATVPSNIRINGTSLQNPEVFRSMVDTLSNSKFDIVPMSSSSMQIPSSTSQITMSFESPKLIRHRHSKRQSSLDSYRQHQRQRLHSGSSCYESDSTDLSSDNEDKFEWRPINQKALVTMSSPSKKRSHSINRLDLPHDYSGSSFPNYNLSTKTNNRPKLFQYIEDNVIGNNHIFQGPWGLRQMIYCDYTASGRPLQFIENYIKTNVLPLYGNTHSETSLCAQQTTKFREEARNLIKKSVNANENDILLFSGTGSTGAIHTLVNHFDLQNDNTRQETVVIISAFEHHSNILPWKETGVTMIRIPTTQQGILDKTILEEQLQYYSKLNKRIICSLNAASNITGILTDVNAISTLVHYYSGFIFWDYATAAPYVKIDMNPSTTAYKDAIFISTHKFVGGPGTPGILIAKKNLFSLKAPKVCGGGTVNFVTRTCHEYNSNIEIREEGGTPDIIGCIRAGLVFQLKDSIDINYLQSREDELVKRFNRRFKKLETLIVLGSSTATRLPIFSFVIYVPGICKYLHHNFVCLLLNDLFGVQVRSGCACAGPYGLDLLNIDDAKTDVYCMFMTEDICIRENDQIARTMMMKPGFTRLNLSFFTNDEEIDYVLNAIHFIATDGWKFLPLYTYNPVTAGWIHRSGFHLPQSSLETITYKSGKMQYNGNKKPLTSSRGERILPDPFREANLIATDAMHWALETIDYTTDPSLNIPEKYQHMVWFALPIDIALMMVKQNKTGQENNCNIDSIPFIPLDAKERLVSSGKTSEILNGGDNRKKNNSMRAPSRFRVR